jgi:hypothetical protein
MVVLVLLSMGGLLLLVVLAGLVDGRVVGRWEGGHDARMFDAMALL